MPDFDLGTFYVFSVIAGTPSGFSDDRPPTQPRKLSGLGRTTQSRWDCNTLNRYSPSGRGRHAVRSCAGRCHVFSTASGVLRACLRNPLPLLGPRKLSGLRRRGLGRGGPSLTGALHALAIFRHALSLFTLLWAAGSFAGSADPNTEPVGRSAQNRFVTPVNQIV